MQIQAVSLGGFMKGKAMTDREKLIQIIDSSRTYVADKENLADYLIANGVTFALDKPRPRPKGWQPMGAKSFMEYCPTCKNDGSDLCGMCIMEVKSGYEPKENFPQVVVSPFEDASNNKEMYFKCGMRHMKAMVLAMLQDILDQEDGLCLIDLSEVIKAVEDL